ncbi:hypothetical protein [Flavobacterium salmonis]|uniref:Uncharacterized protein n=1 Tax=Flavobacterium salmonis TaxID=2654844 RepID=A0A6V6ZD05_9FLAO|nr:hypothetical protein [Flavobacterium salmonis]CAD0009630.1 hypothetical protein FLAT13_05043 [Flavobacterium salmonis]
MAIPINIEREHIFQAILRIEREGIPPRRGAREWAVDYEGIIYPCKLLISWENLYVNGEELNLDPNNFNTYDAQEYLREKGFNVIQNN